MHLSIALAAAGLLASTLAIPHDHHSHHKHSMSYVGTIGAIPTGGASPKHNATGYDTIFRTSTRTVEVAEDQIATASPPEQSLDESPSEPQDKHKASHNADAATCNVQTVTVTDANTVTVTVGAEAAPSTPTEPIVQSEPLLKAPKSVSHAPPASTPSVAAAGGSTETQAAKEVNNEAPSSSSVVPSSPPAAASSTAADDNAPADDNTPAPKAAAQPKGLPFKTKRGVIASTNTMEAVAKNFGVGKVSWMGNWYSAPPGQLSPNLQFVPQNYGTASDEKGVWTKNAQKAIANGDKYFLSFGEPGPGNPDLKLRIDVPTAVQLWHDKIEPYTKQGITIGSPCILQNDKDFDWLDQFMDACNDCTIGFVAVHWVYKADLQHVAEFKRTVEKAKTVADKKGVGVWVDNFYGSGSADDQKAFLGEAVPWLEAQDWVHAYAWVPSGHMTDGDALNDLGEYYANL